MPQDITGLVLQVELAEYVQNEGYLRQERWHWTLTLALDAVLLAYAKQSTMPTSASGTVAMDSGPGDELRASGSCETALSVKCTPHPMAPMMSAVPEDTRWTEVGHVGGRIISSF